MEEETSDLKQHLEGSIEQEELSREFTERIALHEIFANLSVRFQLLAAALSRISHNVHLDRHLKKPRVHPLRH